jgi:hypothetical protein
MRNVGAKSFRRQKMENSFCSRLEQCSGKNLKECCHEKIIQHDRSGNQTCAESARGGSGNLGICRHKTVTKAKIKLCNPLYQFQFEIALF